MKKFLLPALLFSCLALAGCGQPQTEKREAGSEKISSVKINDTAINVEIADTPESTYRGLSFRENLCADCGMLFIFPEKSSLQFVMRNMNFPLDIIFINDNRIINIEKNLPPEGGNPRVSYGSAAPANYVLEVNAGFADRHGIKTGDIITYAK